MMRILHRLAATIGAALVLAACVVPDGDAAAAGGMLPFKARGLGYGTEGGHRWGDGGGGPGGIRIGCIPGRRFSVEVAVQNRTKEPVVVRAGFTDDSSVNVIKRVTVQIRLAPVPSDPNFFTSLSAWSERA